MSVKLLISCWLLGYLSALFTLIGVALGGYLVYRTKREGHESILGGPSKGDVGTARGSYFQDDIEDIDDDDLGMGVDVMQAVKRQNSRFMDQYAKSQDKEA